MFRIGSMALCCLLALAVSAPVDAATPEDAPWGRASASDASYKPKRVVYDVAASSREDFENVLDRVSYLNNLYRADPFRASIVVVLHGDEIPYFAVSNLAENEELMRRAQSLTLAGPIEFRMCMQAAATRGFKPEAIHGFVQMVPMADAELVELQQEGGYAYMQ